MSAPDSSPIPAVPTSTYRLQFHSKFTLRHALELVDYLSRLGVSHVYASPILTARPGSTHGYDIVNHNELNPELGTPADFDAFVEALHARGMGLVLDIVPNHMGVGGKDNAWWLDTLKWGESSPYARYFDIDFKTNRRGLRGKVMIPVLGDQYGKVLQGGELELKFDAPSGSFNVWYHDHCFPIDPRDYGRIVSDTAGGAARIPEAHRELFGRFAQLNAMESEVHDVGQALERELGERAARDPALVRALTQAAEAFRGTPGDLESWKALHALLENQSYRAAYWRSAADEINYRRFFNINDLAGIRVEQEDLFEETHRLVLDWVKQGKVQGLRIDHIDGLFDPKTYCERLQARAGRPGAPAYVVVEKILAPHERLPGDWAVSGTSGYDTLNLINGVFVDPANEHRLDRVYRHFTRRHASFDDVLVGCKKLIMQAALASEKNVLTNELHRISADDLLSRDFTLNSIRDAIEEVFAQMPVYRTYVTPDGSSEQDRRYIDWAIGKARKASSAADTSVFDFLQAVLTGTLPTNPGRESRFALKVAMRAQQISGPVMAKGMEDTAFYRYQRLISLNEVGGDPRRFGVSLATFHRANGERLEHWPHDMLAASTHDTKRGEDGRARINVLSELPMEWARQVRIFMRMNRSRRTELEGAEPMPNASDEYLYYQALVGAWPLDLALNDKDAMRAFAERVAAFMQKALREGKESSSWDNPKSDYEAAVERFVYETLEPSATNPFPEQMGRWIERIGRLGAINSLSQTLLRLTMPGLPDTYRGSELWDLSLVDPDNRRPVDYGFRRRLLDLTERVASAFDDPDRRRSALAELREGWKDGREKLHLLRCVLSFRRQHAELFRTGSYTALVATGSHAEHVCAFARENGSQRVVAIAPRLLVKLWSPERGIEWGDTALSIPPGSYRCLLTGTSVDVRDASEAVPLARLLGELPVALLAAV
ncbi:MAG TPA: malto-oligosyltrehalose synthase [Polyangiaceae bacterium]|nr:malto-oligosyltrehalose synthase [Polyangiaceae bacterium]